MCFVCVCVYMCVYGCVCVCVCEFVAFMFMLLNFFYRETNLKVRQPLPETAAMKDSEEALGDFNGI